jgi:hypothetical protein
MEMSQGNSLYSYLKQTKMSLFFHLQNQRTGGQKSSSWGAGTSGKGEEGGKGHGRVNKVQILCPHVCKWENDICSNSGMGGRRVKKSGGGANSSMIYLIYFKNFCKCHNVYSASITIK